ncbi:hypothetical protein EIN_079030 [Entamoeba invadens IP1]|uniref:hypothetical protein n=1 Tax=Entamoeba invadens IP1 TaxID=370355 RepID=UPI0002C3F283|nr:hypothetical protein EIN_079030 [Entamoeba invadens IP1]ELP85001.1 hypothetical protein EIN_079030 [Entamoeba invadens IP1]|eukprot:XP_004184347.1 hypothetical protein EIN_079030 [Entamoeba invadens IP1]
MSKYTKKYHPSKPREVFNNAKTPTKPRETFTRRPLKMKSTEIKYGRLSSILNDKPPLQQQKTEDGFVIPSMRTKLGERIFLFHNESFDDPDPWEVDENINKTLPLPNNRFIYENNAMEEDDCAPITDVGDLNELSPPEASTILELLPSLNAGELEAQHSIVLPHVEQALYALGPTETIHNQTQKMETMEDDDTSMLSVVPFGDTRSDRLDRSQISQFSQIGEYDKNVPTNLFQSFQPQTEVTETVLSLVPFGEERANFVIENETSNKMDILDEDKQVKHLKVESPKTEESENIKQIQHLLPSIGKEEVHNVMEMDEEHNKCNEVKDVKSVVTEVPIKMELETPIVNVEPPKHEGREEHNMDVVVNRMEEETAVVENSRMTPNIQPPEPPTSIETNRQISKMEIEPSYKYNDGQSDIPKIANLFTYYPQDYVKNIVEYEEEGFMFTKCEMNFSPIPQQERYVHQPNRFLHDREKVGVEFPIIPPRVETPKLIEEEVQLNKIQPPRITETYYKTKEMCSFPEHLCVVPIQKQLHWSALNNPTWKRVERIEYGHLPLSALPRIVLEDQEKYEEDFVAKVNSVMKFVY